MANTYFTPTVDIYRIEDSVIHGIPELMMADNARIPLMIGVTDSETKLLMDTYQGWLCSYGSEKVSKIFDVS